MRVMGRELKLNKVTVRQMEKLNKANNTMWKHISSRCSESLSF